MHVALWSLLCRYLEADSRRKLCEFSLMAEGFAFSSADIYCERRRYACAPRRRNLRWMATPPSNTRFHPVSGVSGLWESRSRSGYWTFTSKGLQRRTTAVWQPRGTALCGVAGSAGYLSRGFAAAYWTSLYGALPHLAACRNFIVASAPSGTAVYSWRYTQPRVRAAKNLKAYFSEI